MTDTQTTDPAAGASAAPDRHPDVPGLEAPAPPSQAVQHGLSAHTHGGAGVPSQSRGEHLASFDVGDYPVPSGREEEWRFTPLDRLGGLMDGQPSDAHLAIDTDLPTNVQRVDVEPGDALLREVPAPIDRLGALALARSGGAVLVTVAPDADVAAPVVVRLHGEGGPAPAWGHLIVDLGAFARATVVLEHSGSARYDAGVSVLVGDGAELTLVSIQDWDDDAVHVGHVAFRVGRDAKVRSTQVTLGGDLVRITETVEYTGTGGDVELAGLYFADAGQHLEQRLFIDHGVPNCRSNVVYKGALQGDGAHTVWIGDVLIRHVAEGTDTYELNRNLILTDGARADSVPNLEIETGEIVGAGHASATGRFDDEQLFYLMSRGIHPEEARKLVVRGFFNELLGKVPVDELRERLAATIETRLDEVGA